MEHWLPFVYVYTVGGTVFVLSLLAGLRAGAIDLGRSADRRTLYGLVAGLTLFATVHAAWIWTVSRESVSEDAPQAVRVQTVRGADR